MKYLGAGIVGRSKGANALRPVDGQERQGRGLTFPKLSSRPSPFIPRQWTSRDRANMSVQGELRT
jgi:hypothetical protein